MVICGLNLLHQAHKQDVRPRCHPFIVQSLLGLAPNDVVRGLQAMQQLIKSFVYIWAKNRHVELVRVEVVMQRIMNCRVELPCATKRHLILGKGDLKTREKCSEKQLGKEIETRRRAD